MPLSPQHYLVAVLALIAVGLLAASYFGVWQRSRAEANAGIEALCSFKWRDYSHLVEDILIERGFRRGGGERRPGDGGFDLMMERGNARYIVACKNGSTHEVTEKEVRDLATVMQMEGAEGAVLATTGGVEPAALRVAAARRIEILSGEELWRQARPWVPHEVREEVQAEARAERNRSAIYSVGAGVAAAALSLFVVPMLQQGASDMTSVDIAPDSVESGDAPSRLESLARDLPMPPDLTSEEAAARRASVVMELRGVPNVFNASWSTPSTLVVTLRPGSTKDTGLPKDLCQRILQYEELRYTRMQIETPSEQDDAPPQVRWRQCR